MLSIKNELFVWEFNRIGKIPELLTEVNFNGKRFNNSNKGETTNKIFKITLFPNYLKTSIANNNSFRLKKIKHLNFSGAGITFKYPETIDGFLSKYMKSQDRKNIKRSISRLETSFNINYKIYYGSITKEDYTFLLEKLRTFLEIRFSQKQMLNYFLNEWDKNINGLYKLIIQKKASFFTIYDRDKLISISLNRHFENCLMFSDCNGYDIDYNKYGIGNLDNYRLTKWCIENKYDFLDLGVGIVDYKKKWCDTYYNFDYLIYYRKKSIAAKVLSTLEIGKINMKNTIKKIKIDKLIKNLKKKQKYSYENISYNIEQVPNLDTFNIKKEAVLDIYSQETKDIRKAVYDYLYTNKLHINTVNIYQILNETNTYLLKFPKEILKVTVNKDRYAG
ncbi:MAG: GNAT family N-acetyltransferase [Aestuariibaculum sp.]